MYGVLRTGAPWRDLPEGYGPWQTVATRFYRWVRSGLVQRLLEEVQRQADAAGDLAWDLHDVDGTVIRAHQHAAGAKKGDQPTPRQRKRGGGDRPLQHQASPPG
jgi:transposase